MDTSAEPATHHACVCCSVTKLPAHHLCTNANARGGLEGIDSALVTFTHCAPTHSATPLCNFTRAATPWLSPVVLRYFHIAVIPLSVDGGASRTEKILQTDSRAHLLQSHCPLH